MTVYGRQQSTFLDYDGFVEKFKSKKTTDDCLTPSPVFKAAYTWAQREYLIAGRPAVRPFWPGGDYQMFDYPDGCVVFDNPPFSILTEVVRWLHANRLDYFLFAPHLTAFSIARDCPVNYVMAGATVTYENGASINTSFVTSLGPWRVRNAPALTVALEQAQLESASELPAYEWPDELIRTTTFDRLSAAGIEVKFGVNECAPIGNLEALRRQKKSIFGNGFLISVARAEQLRAEQLRAEQLRAEQLRAEQLRAKRKRIPLVLSSAERATVDALSCRLGL